MFSCEFYKNFKNTSGQLLLIFFSFIQWMWVAQFVLVLMVCSNSLCIHCMREVFSNKWIEKSYDAISECFGHYSRQRRFKLHPKLPKGCTISSCCSSDNDTKKWFLTNWGQGSNTQGVHEHCKFSKNLIVRWVRLRTTNKYSFMEC